MIETAEQYLALKAEMDEYGEREKARWASLIGKAVSFQKCDLTVTMRIDRVHLSPESATCRATGTEKGPDRGYWQSAMCDLLTVIPEPVRVGHCKRLLDAIDDVEHNAQLTVGRQKQKLAALRKSLNTQQARCIHYFQERKQTWNYRGPRTWVCSICLLESEETKEE